MAVAPGKRPEAVSKNTARPEKHSGRRNNRLAPPHPLRSQLENLSEWNAPVPGHRYKLRRRNYSSVEPSCNASQPSTVSELSYVTWSSPEDRESFIGSY